MTPPPFFQTWTFIKRLAEQRDMTFGKLASACGKEVKTAESWSREPASNANPNGTGKKNPLDCVLRVIGMAHGEDRGLAREMAEIFPAYVDYLEGISKQRRPLNDLLCASVKETSEAFVELVRCAEAPDYHRAIKEITDAQIALQDDKEEILAMMREGVKDQARLTTVAKFGRAG